LAVSIKTMINVNVGRVFSVVRGVLFGCRKKFKSTMKPSGLATEFVDTGKELNGEDLKRLAELECTFR